MKVLVVAIDGQVRSKLESQLAVRGHLFESVGNEWLQSTDTEVKSALSLAITDDIDLVVNALSFELLQLQADAGLVERLALLVDACEQASIPLIQLSSSQVFDGVDGGRHREVEPMVPASRLGALLCRMEELVRHGCQQHIIIRTGPVFSSVGDNLLTSIIRGFRRGEVLVLSNIGSSCPIHARDLARVISAIIDQLSCGAEPWGTYHYCSSDPASSYLFAETVLAVVTQYTEAFDQPLRLESVDTVDAGWCWPLLNCEKILNTFGIKQLPWRGYVVSTVKKICESEKEESTNE